MKSSASNKYFGPAMMVRGLLIAALGSVIVYVVLGLVADGPAMIAALQGFPASTFAMIAVLSVGCYVVRGLRWGWLVRTAGYEVSHPDALYLHLAGQTMSVSPGRVGEVLKPWLTREVCGLPMSKGISLIFAERVADLIAVILLSVGGLSVLRGGGWTLAAAGAAVAVGTAVAGSARFHRIAMRAVMKQQWALRHLESAEAISNTVQHALAPRRLLPSVLASTLAWGLEGIGFVLCLDALGFNQLGLVAISVYAISTIIGALTFLPGGIGMTEASMAGILVAAGMDSGGASAATLITRVLTLWLAVGIGWLALLSRPALFRRALGATTADD